MTWLVWILVVVVAIPVATWSLEVLLGSLLRGRARHLWTGPEAADEGRKVAILMPAHNEEQGLRTTLDSVLAQLPKGGRVVVVADNCTDQTANIAEGLGCEVVRRTDLIQRGKGYALAAGIDHLAADPPDIVIVVDADAWPAPACLQELARGAASTGCPTQADYIMVAAPDSGIGTRLSSFAFMVRNRVRPRGLACLGGPSHLAGSGMAFPWPVLAGAPRTFGHLAEDLLMGVDLALAGYPAVYWSPARMESAAAPTAASLDTQRKRWEQGHLAVMGTHLPRVLEGAVASGRGDLLLLALDLAVPPLSLLVMLLGGTFAVAAALAASGASIGPLLLSSAEVAAIGVALLAAWLAEGRQMLPFVGLLAVPAYVVQRVGRMLLSRLTRSGKAKWNRTDRSS